MTQLLEQAIAQLQQLSASDQDAIASLILAEIADEKTWDDAFAASQDQLAKMAAKVRDEIQDGRIRDIGMDEL